jgi:general secretion pathway protein M
MKALKAPALPAVWQARLESARQRARAFWLQRTPRERRLLTAAGALVCVWLLWAAALRPALNAVDEGRTKLPALRANLAQVQALIIEAQVLQRGRAQVQDVESVQTALAASLQRAGLNQASVERQAETGAGVAARWAVSFDQAPASRVVEWLSSLAFLLQLETRQVDLARSQVDGRDRAGLLTGRVDLVMPAKEGR